MQILYFRDIEKKKIILVHGFQAPYQMWKPYIDYYKNDYCIIIPILPGHNVEIKDEFISFKNTIDDFEQQYIEKFGKDVYMVYAISMGGVFATNLFSRGNLNIQKLVLESSPLFPFGKLVGFLAGKKYIKIAQQMRSRNPKLLKKLAKSIEDKSLYNEFLNIMDNMTESTIKNYLNELLNYTFPKNINTKDTEMYYYYGGVKNEILFKYAAKYIKKYYPQTNTICIEGKKHCEGVIINPKEKINLLNKILNS